MGGPALLEHAQAGRSPYVVWLTNVEILQGPIAETINVDEMIADVGADTFTQSQGSPGVAPVARKVFRSHRSHPQLTATAAQYIGERFAAAASEKGIVPSGRTSWDMYAPGAFSKT